MSAAQYTPGPWTACELGSYSDYEGNCRVILGDDRRIAVVQGAQSEDEANARLIAESPEMLALLQHAIRHPMITEGSEWWTKVLIVVDKATGSAA